MNRISLIISLIFSALGAVAQVTVDVKIDTLEMFIGEQRDLTLTVTARRGARIETPQFTPSQYITPGVEVLDCGKADTTDTDNNIIKVTRRYTLTSFDEKLYYIPPITVRVNGKGYKSKSLALKVLSFPVDTLHADKFYPPKDVQNNPFEWSEWSSVFWLSVMFMLVAVVAVYLLSRLKQNKPVIAHVRLVKRMPPHQKALKDIEQIKDGRMTVQEDQKAYYTLLTDVLRRYIKERFGFNATEMTSSEIIEKLQQEGDKKMIDELKELFMTADLVKFAKYSTLINENDANLVNAVEFINTTKQEGQPIVERIEPKLTDSDRQNMRTRTTLKVAIGVLFIASVALLVAALYQVYLLI